MKSRSRCLGAVVGGALEQFGYERSGAFAADTAQHRHRISFTTGTTVDWDQDLQLGG